MRRQGTDNGGRQLRRPYLAFIRLSTLSIFVCASATADFIVGDIPVLVRVSSRYAVHLKPVGLAVCTIWYWRPLYSIKGLGA